MTIPDDFAALIVKIAETSNWAGRQALADRLRIEMDQYVRKQVERMRDTGELRKAEAL